MKEALRTSAVMLAVMTLLTGGLYPAVVTAIARVAFPSRSNGSLIFRDGKPVGSSLIGQPFAKPGYFWARPSATTPAPYNAASSGGSNLGPLNPALKERVQSRIDALRQADPSIKSLPVDLVTASGSGLDPHISPAAAEAQVSRVAKARGKSEDEIRALVLRHTEGRQLGLLGEPRVNVLGLNLELDFPGLALSSGIASATVWKIPLPTRLRHRAGPDRLRTGLNLWEILSPEHRRVGHDPSGRTGGQPGLIDAPGHPARLAGRTLVFRS